MLNYINMYMSSVYLNIHIYITSESFSTHRACGRLVRSIPLPAVMTTAVTLTPAALGSPLSCIHMYIYIYIHVYVYIYIFIYIYIDIPVLSY